MATLSWYADVLLLHLKIVLHSANFKSTRQRTKCGKNGKYQEILEISEDRKYRP